MFLLFSSLRTRSSADCHCFEQLCVEYKESNNDEITSSAEKVVRPWPDRPDRRLRPCKAYTRVMWRRKNTLQCIAWFPCHWFWLMLTYVFSPR